MKRTITLAIDEDLLKKARALAAQRGSSVSSILARELSKIVEGENAYQEAKRRTLAWIQSLFHLGGGRMIDRDSWRDRRRLR